jgi:hypothetical protein
MKIISRNWFPDKEFEAFLESTVNDIYYCKPDKEYLTHLQLIGKPKPQSKVILKVVK